MLSLQRVIGILIVILALVIAIVPSLYNCEAYADEGSMSATTMGGGMTDTTMGASAGTSQPVTARMPCHYSARSAVLIAIPLAILGLLLLVSKRRETNRALAVLGISLGAVTMAVPSVVGVCGMATMICNEVLKPTLLLAGGMVVVLSAILLVLGERRRESIA
jgi:hypothetical protein